MNIEEFRNYCLSKKGVTEQLPFGPDALVFKVMGKMFALSALERLPPQVNLKCDPERAISLREEHDGDIVPGYHMSKTHWNTLYLDHLSPKLIVELVDHSYDLVVAKLTQRAKRELDAID
ncbi:MmcQ/YjbR family DNA-binding protein [Pricia sp. S334]|uniref:MmcQ/YjbR family DNA-binding protein n=1 Tax=Pricia mediterranea TaxID=3076079 RepID=A0ABU3L897_9FLAO|nr:MmcQ/YjbR family DNA-binding protein [Pricia sp. S334]MDT7829419.1 MmcQ/YjbR family DNA-binding protein [Pricia sp. S334]